MKEEEMFTSILKLSVWLWFTTTTIICTALFALPAGYPVITQMTMISVKSEFTVMTERRLLRACFL